MILYNHNVDLVNANVYTKFGYILSIHSQGIEQKPNSEVNQGFKKKEAQLPLHNPNVDLVNANVFTEFNLILSIHSQDMEQKPNSDVNLGP